MASSGAGSCGTGPSAASASFKRVTGNGSNETALNMVIRQNSFSITLDAWAMLVASLLLISGMQFLRASLLQGIVVAVPVVLLVRNDYNNFLLLGPGGTPSTFAGYLRLLWLRLFALRDVYHCPPVADRTLTPSRGILHALPYRPGPRPRIAGLAPQRQLDQHGSTDCSARLRAAVEDLTHRHPECLSTATSCIEKYGFGLFARRPVNVWAQGEVCHIHDSDKSMHMSLHPDDIKEILDKGWGQRHPLAFSSWVKAPLPPTFVMIYAPRDDSDLQVVARIIEAAVWYIMAQEVDLRLSGKALEALPQEPAAFSDVVD